MTAALDPHSAAGYLELLSCDLRTVGVRKLSGEMVAGEPPDSAHGTLISAPSGDLTIEATVGPHGLRRLLDYDLQTASKELSRWAG